MKLVFVHDHKFRKINEDYYSPGGLHNDVLAKYADIFDEVVVISRVIKESIVLHKYSKIKDKRITIYSNDRLKEIVQEADVVISRLPSINGFRAVYYAKKYKKKYLVEVVGCIWDAYTRHSLLGKFVAFPAFMLLKFAVKKAPYVLYVTQSFLQKKYPCDGIQIGVSDVRLPSTSEVILSERIKKIQKDRDTITLGTLAATDVKYKGQKYVIESLKILEKLLDIRLKYQIAGPGNDDFLKYVAHKGGVSNQVIFVGSLSHENVFSWLDNIDIYIHPSELEGLSRSIIEAMSRGLPCIAADVGGNFELIDKDFLFSLKNKKNIPEEISRSLKLLLHGKQMEVEAKKNFFKIQTYFNPEQLEKTREQFYSQLKK